MKKILFFVFLIFTAQNAFSKGVLWIPSENSPIQGVLEELEIDPDLSLTLAPPANIDEISKKTLDKLVKSGKVEISIRPSGDPVCSLFYYPESDSAVPESIKKNFSDNAFFMAQRISDAKNGALFDSVSFSNSPGAVSGKYVPIAKSMSIKWIAAGPLVSTAAYKTITCEGIDFIPFALVKSSESFKNDFLVFDETLPDSEKTRKLLTDFVNNPLFVKSSVMEELKVSKSTEVFKKELPLMFRPWIEDYSVWISAKSQTGFLSILSKIRDEIMRFAGLPGAAGKIGKVLNDFYKVESGPALLALNDKSPGMEDIQLEMQKKLANIYILMGQNLPNWLFKSFAQSSPEKSFQKKVFVESGNDFISFSNSNFVSSSTFQVPLFRIGWDKKDISMSVETKIPESSASLKTEDFSFEIYIDVNNRARAGITKTLNAKDMAIHPKNAWEYAVRIKNGKAVLYYAAFLKYKKLAKVSVDEKDGIMNFDFSRKLLRGHPLKWGYSLIVINNLSGEIKDIFKSSSSETFLTSLRVSRK